MTLDTSSFFSPGPNLGKAPSSILLQSTLPAFSVLQKDTGATEIYNTMDNKTQTGSDIANRDKTLLKPYTSVDRYIILKRGGIIPGPIVFDNVSIGLPDSVYHNLSLTDTIENLLTLKLTKKLKNDLMTILGDITTYVPGNYIHENLKAMGHTEASAVTGKERYKRAFNFDHVILHDIAHQFEPENIIQGRYTLPPYHVYQHHKMGQIKAGLSKDFDEDAHGRVWRNLRLAFKNSMRNEFLISHFQYAYTDIFTMLTYQDCINTANTQADIMKACKENLSGALSVSCTGQVNDMLRYINSDGWLKARKCSEKLTDVCTNTTQKLADLIENELISYYNNNVKRDALIKQHGNLSAGIWHLIANEFGHRYFPYIPQKHESPYDYHELILQDLMAHNVAQQAHSELEYLYKRNHDTAFLLCQDDTPQGVRNLSIIEKFFLRVYGYDMINT